MTHPKTRLFFLIAALALTSLQLMLAQGPMDCRCGSMEHLATKMKQDPSLAQRMDAIEAHTRLMQGAGSRNGTVITIPVVFHIVYNTPAQNMSVGQIQSQLAVLNEDFRRQNADAANTPAQFQSVAADIEINFCLATQDPQGNPTTGITRTATNVTLFDSNTDQVKFTAQGGKDAWPRDQYLNIWVAPLQGPAPGTQLLGYAQFPGGAAATDGVVIAPTVFGRGGSAVAPYNLGRTCTHEVGHWLNLRHIWGDGPCGQDDFVSDTPEADAPTSGCPVGASSCGSINMIQNYMDYSNDACMNLFTQGQKARMRALFASGGDREALLTSPGCGGAGGGTPGGGAATWQVNQPTSTLLLGGVTASPSNPAITNAAVNVGVPLQITTSLVGAPYDALFTFVPLISLGQGALVSNNGQIVNADVSDPSFQWVFGGGAQASFAPHPGNYTVTLTASSPGSFGFQQVVLDPQNPDGFALSQGCQLEVTAGGGGGPAPTFPQGPTSDDGTITVDLGALAVTFYGTTYSQLHIAANGRVTFGAADGNYEPTINGAASGQPFVGFWTDLDPSSGGSIDILSPAPGIVRVEWNGVPYYAEPFSTVTFAIEFDTNTNAVVLDDLLLVPQNPQFAFFGSGQSQFLGLSSGGPGAVNAGFTSFAPGASGGSTSAAPMLFDWYDWTGFSGLAPSFFSNVNRIVFTPSGSGYGWAGY